MNRLRELYKNSNLLRYNLKKRRIKKKIITLWKILKINFNLYFVLFQCENFIKTNPLNKSKKMFQNNSKKMINMV